LGVVAIARTLHSGASTPARITSEPGGRRENENEPPLEVCITSPYPMTMQSGISRFVRELGRALGPRNVQISVTCPGMQESVTPNMFHMIHLRWGFLKNLELALRTGMYLATRGRMDVLHAQQAHLQSAAALLVARIRGVPGLLTLHVRVPRPETALRRMLLAATEWLSIRFASKVVAVSRSVAETFDDSKMTIVENGVDTNRFAPSPERRAALREALGLGLSPTFVFAGRLSKTKGLDLLIRAATGNVLRNRDFRLVILGERSTEEPLLMESLLPSLPDDRLRVIGRVSEETMPSYLCAADVFVLPSRIEGMPLVALEALACGVPLLVSDIPPLRDLVSDSGAGSTFRSGDVGDLERAMSEILLTGPQRDQQDLAREAAIHRYSIKTMATRYVELYQDLGRQRRDTLESRLLRI
jgi:glycosyltransferase involved in cell wall biosynthesis